MSEGFLIGMSQAQAHSKLPAQEHWLIRGRLTSRLKGSKASRLKQTQHPFSSLV